MMYSCKLSISYISDIHVVELKMDVFAWFVLLALPFPMQALRNHFGKTADEYQQVEFDIDEKISLDISEDGVNSRGWTITPLSYPVVRIIPCVHVQRGMKLCLSFSLSKE